MNSTQAGSILRRLRKLAGTAAGEPVSDAELVERFAAQHEELAFAELLRRHGPMVLRVCRSVLRDWHDAEDAFQATFLVLAQKAASICHREVVASWLHGVARRVALAAEARAARRRFHERRVAAVEDATPLLDMTVRELQRVVDEELQRLPEKFRAPLILCYLQERTQDEAARQLGLSAGAVRGRLKRGKEVLRKRLARRGLTVPGGLLLTALSGIAGAAQVQPTLAGATVRGALLQLAASKAPAGTVSQEIIALAEGVIHTMAGNKLKVMAALLLLVGLTVGGVTLLAHGGQAAKPAGQPPPAAAASKEAARPVQAATDEVLSISGKVLAANGRPVAKAAVAVLRWPADGGAPERVAGTEADEQGRFALQAPRPSTAGFDGPGEFVILANQTGHGLAWRVLDTETPKQTVEIRLAREQIIRGRLIDLQGQSAAGVRLHVVRLGKNSGNSSSTSSSSGSGVSTSSSGTMIDSDSSTSTSSGSSDGVSTSSTGTTTSSADLLTLPGTSKGLHPWPAPAVTDAQGRFTLRGLGANLVTVRLKTDDERFAVQIVDVRPRDKDQKEVQCTLEPARMLEGVVRRADTGKPVPQARVVVVRTSDWQPEEVAVADGQGRFRVRAPLRPSFRVIASAPPSAPCLRATQQVKWPRGAVRHQTDLTLEPGVLVRGKVTESPSGKPVAGATLDYQPFDRATQGGRSAAEWAGPVVTGADGTFQAAVPPWTGHLLVTGPTRDYVEKVTPLGTLFQGAHLGGYRTYAHAVVPLKNIKAGDKRLEVAVELRRGVTLKGRVVDPDGKTAAGVLMMTRLTVPARRKAEPWLFVPRGFPVRLSAGTFELRGCDPAETYHVQFLDARNGLGASVALSGKQAGGEAVTVRLARCGSAVVRVRDFLERPAGRLPGTLFLVVTPGPTRIDPQGTAVAEGKLYAEELEPQHIDPVCYRSQDKEGNYTYPNLIPGATYRLSLLLPRVGFVSSDFTVRAGETLRLPDVNLPEAGGP